MVAVSLVDGSQCFLQNRIDFTFRRLKEGHLHLKPWLSRSHRFTTTRASAPTLVTPGRAAILPVAMKASKITQQNAAWLQQQEPFGRLLASACLTLVEAAQMEAVLEGDKLLRAEQRVTDLIIMREGHIQSTGPHQQQVGAIPLCQKHGF